MPSTSVHCVGDATLKLPDVMIRRAANVARRSWPLHVRHKSAAQRSFGVAATEGEARTRGGKPWAVYSRKDVTSRMLIRLEQERVAIKENATYEYSRYRESPLISGWQGGGSGLSSLNCTHDRQ